MEGVRGAIGEGSDMLPSPVRNLLDPPAPAEKGVDRAGLRTARKGVLSGFCTATSSACTSSIPCFGVAREVGSKCKACVSDESRVLGQ